jgi:heptosyltransferase-2
LQALKKLPQKILIREVNWIGDAVLTIPSIHSIRRAFPDAHISLLVKPWVADIFKENADINEVIIYGDEHQGFGRFKFAGMLKMKNFDTAILLQNAFDAALLAWLAEIPCRIGYGTDFRGLLLTTALPLSKDIMTQHQVNYYLNIVKSIGIDTAETLPYLILSDNERQYARRVILPVTEQNLPLIGINPGATYGSAKRWLPERFTELIIKIINELDGRVILFGSPSEVNHAEDIVNGVISHGQHITDQTSRVLNMAGKTSLRELAALIAECDAFITNDSGPMHMASALLVPIVAIFGSTDSTTTGPFGQGHKVVSKNLPCAPCMKRECPEGHLNCMSEISVSDVFSALKEVLPRNRAVFLDKDGTIIEDKHYLNCFDDLVIIPGAKEGLQRLKGKGFKLIGITNQSGIARGIVEETFVRESNAHLKKELGIDAFYHCPHHPDEQCACRKPEPKLALMARIEHKINLRASYVIGDKESDVQLARNVGAAGVLISARPPEHTSASYIAGDLKDAVEWILAQ